MNKYFKMRKLGLPDGPIRQKMQTDNCTPSDIATFFGEPLPAPVPTGPSPELRETLQKYFKMKKMGLPDGAIRQKMMAGK